eukprot:g48526.t1
MSTAVSEHASEHRRKVRIKGQGNLNQHRVSNVCLARKRRGGEYKGRRDHRDDRDKRDNRDNNDKRDHRDTREERGGPNFIPTGTRRKKQRVVSIVKASDQYPQWQSKNKQDEREQREEVRPGLQLPDNRELTERPSRRSFVLSRPNGTRVVLGRQGDQDARGDEVEVGRHVQGQEEEEDGEEEEEERKDGCGESDDEETTPVSEEGFVVEPKAADGRRYVYSHAEGLQHQLEELSRQLAEETEHRYKLEREIQYQKENNEQTKSLHDTMLLSLDKLYADVEKKIKERDKAEHARDRAMEDLKQAKEEIQRVQRVKERVLDDWDKQNKKDKEEMNRLSEGKRKIEKDRDWLAEELRKAENWKKKAEKDSERLLEENDRLKKEKECLLEENDRLRSERTRAVEERDHQKRKIEWVEEERDQARQEKQNLEERLRRLETEAKDNVITSKQDPPPPPARDASMLGPAQPVAARRHSHPPGDPPLALVPPRITPTDPQLVRPPPPIPMGGSPSPAAPRQTQPSVIPMTRVRNHGSRPSPSHNPDRTNRRLTLAERTSSSTLTTSVRLAMALVGIRCIVQPRGRQRLSKADTLRCLR